MNHLADNFIHHLFISPNHIGTGAGKALLQHAVKICNGDASLKCNLRNKRACEFYLHHGWKEGSEQGEDVLGPWKEFYYSKE